MKKKNIFVFIGLLLCSVSSFAQKKEVAKSDPGEIAYKELVDKIKAGDQSVDFKAIRIAFTGTKNYSPYGGDRDKQKAAFDAIDKKNYKDAVKKAEEMLEDNYVDMDAHVAALLGYQGLGNADKEAYHKKVYLGFVNSILTSGDGKTAETAYVVITTHEEYIVLRALGLSPGSQALQHLNGHSFDVLTATDPKSKESIKIYFNIDVPWKAETDIFK